MILGTGTGLAASHAGKGRVQDQAQRDSKTVTQNFVKNGPNFFRNLNLSFVMKSWCVLTLVIGSAPV
jgi:hypothetical protein